MRLPIYLDHHSTTPVDRRVAEVVAESMLVDFGNPSSADHTFGDKAEALVTSSAEIVSQLIDAIDAEIIFTSGATESINLAILGFAGIFGARRPLRIGFSGVEHAAVLQSVQAAKQMFGAEPIEFSVDGCGRLDLDQIASECSKGLDLICVMAANNEVGNIYPLEEIGQIAARHGSLLLVNATQAVGRIPVHFEDWKIDLLAISSHKIYGPKGVGALAVRRGLQLRPMIVGGGQQRNLRSGTLNVPGIVGLGVASKLRRAEQADDEQRIAELRNRLQMKLLEQVPGSVINGDPSSRLAGNLNVSFPVPSHAVVGRVRREIAISTGSACSSGLEQPSHVLRAMRLESWRMEGAVRFGIGKDNTQEEIDYAAELVASAVQDILAVQTTI